MSRPTLCDVCDKQCDPLKVVQITGWWGKQLVRKGEGKGKKALDDFEPVRRSDKKSIVADICSDCMESKFSGVQLQQVPTRQHQINEVMATGASPFTALRTCMGYMVDNVYCDFCQAECYDNHLSVKGVGTPEFDLAAAVCESCHTKHLQAVKFQPEKPSVPVDQLLKF
jgi:hypothetical protein